MAGDNRPGETGSTGEGRQGGDRPREDDLERRRRELGAVLAARWPKAGPVEGERGGAGYGQALRLSSEFIAGVLVGVGLGWVFDRLAGTSPWGLIVFLLLGFGAGVLNVLRSAGLVAEVGTKKPGDRDNDKN